MRVDPLNKFFFLGVLLQDIENELKLLISFFESVFGLFNSVLYQKFIAMPDFFYWLNQIPNFDISFLVTFWPQVFLFFIFFLFFIKESSLDNIRLRKISLQISLLIFVCSLYLFLKFDPYTSEFQFLNRSKLEPAFYNFSMFFEIDGISIFFILLTTFITPICLLVSWEVALYLRYLIIYFFLIEFFLLIAFSTTNLLIFFIAFESILIPMFLIIGIWGTRFERIKAAYLFFLYTLVGSIFFFMNLIAIQSTFGTFDFVFLQNIEQELSLKNKILLWLFFFFAFAVKIPMFPFHIWLPEAHVEAPTAGSIMLASLLLKLGGYGFLRFSVNLLPETSKYFLPLIVILCFIGMTYSSLTALRQLDLKRLIAYSSVAHMNYIVLGIFSFNYLGILGSIILMLGHGIVSSGLFLLIGVLYDRHHVRLISYYSGLVIVMPLFSLFFGFFTFTNMAFPGLSNFPGELLILLGLIELNFFIALTTVFGLFLSAVYSIWLLNRLVFGSLKILYTKTFVDISRREFFSVVPLVFLTFVMGLIPNFFFKYIAFSVLSLLTKFL